jgi:hypothetical protein
MFPLKTKEWRVNSRDLVVYDNSIYMMLSDSRWKNIFTWLDWDIVAPKLFDYKRVREDREVIVWDTIVSKEWFKTQVISVNDEWVVVHQRWDSWMNALLYKPDFFWKAFFKWEWRFEWEDIKNNSVEDIISMIPKGYYIEWYKDRFFIQAKDLELWKKYYCESTDSVLHVICEVEWVLLCIDNIDYIKTRRSWSAYTYFFSKNVDDSVFFEWDKLVKISISTIESYFKI